MCLTYAMDVDSAGDDWIFVIGLLKSGDIFTPNVTLGYLPSPNMTGYGLVNLPIGSYRVVFLVQGNNYVSLALRLVDVKNGSCSGRGKFSVIVICRTKRFLCYNLSIDYILAEVCLYSILSS